MVSGWVDRGEVDITNLPALQDMRFLNRANYCVGKTTFPNNDPAYVYDINMEQLNPLGNRNPNDRASNYDSGFLSSTYGFCGER